MKPKLYSVCLSVVTLLVLHGAGAAEPSILLKGVTIIYYSTWSEELIGGEQCKIDETSLATSLQFVANQSVKLKLLSTLELIRQKRGVAEKLNEISKEVFEEVKASGTKPEDWLAAVNGNDKYKAAKKPVDELRDLPSLRFFITPLELPGGCAGVIEAEVSAYADETQMYHTRRTVIRPRIKIWSEGRHFVGPKQTFAEQVTSAAEQLLKEFVNDWTASQELPD